jgi:hypothetical protein
VSQWRAAKVPEQWLAAAADLPVPENSAPLAAATASARPRRGAMRVRVMELMQAAQRPQAPAPLPEAQVP